MGKREHHFRGNTIQMDEAKFELWYTIEKDCPISNPIKEPAYEGDVGYDLGVAITEESVVLKPHQFINLPTGVRIQLPKGVWADVRPRSSTFAKRRLVVLGGTIDNGYRGLLSVFVLNPNPDPVTVQKGDYLAQLVLSDIVTPPLVKRDKLTPSERGNNGFGSSGGFSGV